jgi:uncharacterized protein (TIGR02117 family)
MTKVLFFFFVLSTCLTSAYLLLPKIFLFNLVVFTATTTAVTGFCIWFTTKSFSRKKRLQSVQLSISIVSFALSCIVVFFVEYPFWISIPEGFCIDKRAKAFTCSLESEILPTNEDVYLPIYVVGHGWHTGLVLRSEDIPPELFAGLNLSEGPAIEIGWGSEAFYRATDYTFQLAFKSFVFPNPSVLHVVTLPKVAEQNFGRSDLYVYWASKAEYQRMLNFVADTFTRNELGKFIDLGPGIYGNSRFYRANGFYHFPKSCNAWTVNAIQKAGAPVWPNLALTARNTLHQVKLVGEEIRRTDGFNLLPN